MSQGSTGNQPPQPSPAPARATVGERSRRRLRERQQPRAAGHVVDLTPRRASHLALGVLIWVAAVVAVATLAWLAIDSAGAEVGRPDRVSPGPGQPAAERAAGPSSVTRGPASAQAGSAASGAVDRSAGTGSASGGGQPGGIGAPTVGGPTGAPPPAGGRGATSVGQAGAGQDGAGGGRPTSAVAPGGAWSGPGQPGQPGLPGQPGQPGPVTVPGTPAGPGSSSTVPATRSAGSAPATASASSPAARPDSSGPPARPAASPQSSVSPSPSGTLTAPGSRRVREVVTTVGGFVMGECTGDRVTEFAAEPADGWSAVTSSAEPGGVRTGLQRPGQLVIVHIACANGRPGFTVQA